MKQNFTLLTLLVLLVAGGVVFFAGIGWGLPSHQVDPYLFGGHPVWSGSEIVALGGMPAADNARAADVAAAPVDPDHIVVVNATDEQRARIVRRYRLMSDQPDEFTTFAAFAAMKPARRDFDPRTYKYGGLWIYPVGAMLKLAGIAGWVQLRDVTWYLDHPEAVGRFYVVARVYSAIWGLLGIVAIFFLVRRMGGSVMASAAGSLCFLLMPVVVNAAHEAKPHLAGAVLMLLCVLSAGRYVECGTRASWLTTAILAGLALGMVLSSMPILLVLLAMEWMRPWPLSHASFLSCGLRALRSVSIAGIVFFVTNPYLGINLIRNRAMLHSSFSATAGFYHAGWQGIPVALVLVGIGASLVLALAGGISILGFTKQLWNAWRGDGSELRRRATRILLAMLALLAITQFALFAGGQRPDYARFGLLFDSCLAVEAAILVDGMRGSRVARMICWGFLIATTGWMGSFYMLGYVRDSQGSTTRIASAARINELLDHESVKIAIPLEPAPWNLPPVDLWRTMLFVYPKWKPGITPEGMQASISARDYHSKEQWQRATLLFSSPISSAARSFDIQVARPVAETGSPSGANLKAGIQ